MIEVDGRITDTLKKFNPAGITQPIQLLAVVLGSIVISLIYATIVLKDYYKGWFTIISAVLITYLVITKFLEVLERSPYVFHSPQDYGEGEYADILKSINNYEEDSLTGAEKAKLDAINLIQEIKKESKEKTGTDAKVDESVEKILDKFVASAPSFAYSNLPINFQVATLSGTTDGRIYRKNREGFEALVGQILSEIGIEDISHQKRVGERRIVDFVVKHKGKKIPIEVKYYRNKLAGRELPYRLVLQMKEYMKALNTKESIIIVSSDVTSAAMEEFKELSKPETIHIVVGETKEKLRKELTKLFQ